MRRRLDVLDLSVRDRACLRILLRAKVATTQHLTTLVYHRRQTTQEKLTRLWQAGLVERNALPPLTRGGAPLVYRLTRRARTRLGYAPLTRAEAGMQLRHDLHVLDAICAMLQAHPLAPSGYPVQAWCTPVMSTALIDGVRPDALLALQLTTGSAVLALEVDEGTEHAPVIRHKLARYVESLGERPGWHLVFVVAHDERAAWMAQLGRRQRDERGQLVGRVWVTTIAEMRRKGLGAELTSVGWRQRGRTLASLCVDRVSRQSPTPVATDAWLRVLGSGSSDDARSVMGAR